MRREIHRDRLTRSHGELLLHLRRVPVLGDTVGMDTFGHLSIEHALLRCPPSTSDTRLGIDDDIAYLDLARRNDGQQGQQRRGRITARTSDDARLGDLTSIMLSQAIDYLGLQCRRQVLMAVPFGVDRFVTQPKIGREIDHLEVSWQARDHFLRGGVRQATEHCIHALPTHLLDLAHGR